MDNSNAINDANWNETLSLFQEDYKKAETFGVSWTPPLGEFDGYISEVKTGLTKNSTPEAPDPYLLVTVTLTSGVDEGGNELAGKSFMYGIYTKKTLGFMKSLAAKINSGASPETINEAANIIKNAVGSTAIKFQVVQNGQYKNYNALEVSALEEVPEAGSDDSLPV